jgi:hypothetical protein
LPHYNSRATLIVTVVEGKGEFELVGQRNENQQEQREQDEREEEEEEEGQERSGSQVQRYRARLSPGDVFVIPAGHPIAVSSSSNLYLVGFGINAENNERNFLAGIIYSLAYITYSLQEIRFLSSIFFLLKFVTSRSQNYLCNNF